MIELQRKSSWKDKGLGWGWWRGFLMIECPHGHRNRIGLHKDGHAVATDGTVSPSCVCPGGAEVGTVNPCPFHEFVRLAGWKGVEDAEEFVGP